MLTVAQYRQAYSGQAVYTDARLQAALDGAQATIIRAHGPDYPGDGMLLRATWDLRWQASRRLTMPRVMAAVTRVTQGGGVLDPASYRLEDGGMDLSAVYVPWYLEVVADCVPFDDSAQRDEMQGQLAQHRLMMAQGKGSERMESVIVDRIGRFGAIHPTPVRVEIIAAGG